MDRSIFWDLWRKNCVGMKKFNKQVELIYSYCGQIDSALSFQYNLKKEQMTKEKSIPNSLSFRIQLILFLRSTDMIETSKTITQRIQANYTHLDECFLLIWKCNDQRIKCSTRNSIDSSLNVQ